MMLIVLVLAMVQARAQGKVDIQPLSYWKSIKMLTAMGIDQLPAEDRDLQKINRLLEPYKAKAYLAHMERLFRAFEQLEQFVGKRNFQWEGCALTNKMVKFQTLDDFIAGVPSKASSYMSITSFIASIRAEKDVISKTPMDLSHDLHRLADQVLAELKKSEEPNSGEGELLFRETEAMCYLVKYYAFKIAGAVETAKYRQLTSMKKEHQKYGVREMTNAQVYWRMYSELMSKEYPNPIWMMKKPNDLSWSRTLRLVLDDIDLAKDVLF